MQVTNIDIEQVQYDEVAKRYQGHVALRFARPGKKRPIEVFFLCHTFQPRYSPGPIVTYSLIADALRQARRMPGFRRNEAEIEIVAPAPRLSVLGA